MTNCPYCNSIINTTVSHGFTCPSCSSILHSCKCCSFYNPNVHYGCKETIDEPIWDKEKDNFCDYFRLTNTKLSKTNDREKRAKEALSKLFDF